MGQTLMNFIVDLSDSMTLLNIQKSFHEEEFYYKSE